MQNDALGFVRVHDLDLKKMLSHQPLLLQPRSRDKTMSTTHMAFTKYKLHGAVATL